MTRHAVLAKNVLPSVPILTNAQLYLSVPPEVGDHSTPVKLISISLPSNGLEHNFKNTFSKNKPHVIFFCRKLRW